MSPWQGILALALGLALVGAYLAWRSGRSLRARTGLPQGKVVYADTDQWQRGEPLYAPRYHLTGKPDYLVRSGRTLIPVEVKPGRRADQPYPADVLQLAAYCLLLEETTGQRPAFGLLRYQAQTFRIPFDGPLRETLLQTLGEMRRDLTRRDVPRSHDDPQRCLHCGQRANCEQSLVD